MFVLATEIKVLCVVATNVTTTCFVFLNMISREKKTLLKMKIVIDNSSYKKVEHSAPPFLLSINLIEIYPSALEVISLILGVTH